MSAERYLTFTPWDGQLNNTRMCLETAVVLAHLTRRVLVLPELYRREHEAEWRDGRFRPLHPGEFLDLSALASVVPMIAHHEYAQDTLDGWRHDVVDVNFEPGTAVFCYPCIPADDPEQMVRLGAFAAGRPILLQLSPELEACRTLNIQSAMLEHFYSFFYFSRREDEVRCKRLIRQGVRFKSYVLAAGARIAAALAPFTAVHVRRGDFFWQNDDQNIGAPVILETLAKHAGTGSRIYIATDEMDKTFFTPLQARYEIKFADDFAEELQGLSAASSLACLDQTVCAFGEHFLGTQRSTFSGYITRLRGYFGAADQNIQFTNGSMGSEMDDHDAAPYTWINWLRRGNPLWAREYREAWRF